MKKSFDYLINLPVYTQSETYLGRIVDFEIDQISQEVNKYFVKSANPVKNLFQSKLQIDREQVVSIGKDRMIVEDNKYKIKKILPEPVCPV